ncbi:hypothetical protein KK062_18790 [Fulvivirgaceae bacterium PWU5]|uniref:Tetratricopeptide repeat protein n=1 Tax=Dawidia cretensis TaxID=2782350 RepID=A0AAP2DZL2_9BACT|nr:hypothetical protein [Dawidia cretensis]MBT1710301.1 hypothetical protein [Dawidia cretensis]
MKFRFLLSLFCCFSIVFALRAQTAKVKEMQQVFVADFCECLEEKLSLDPKIILYNQSETCIRGILAKRAELFMEALVSDTVGAGLPDYERGRAFGKYLIINTIEDLVVKCAYYRQAMQELKVMLARQGGVEPGTATRERVQKAVAELHTREVEVPDVKQRAMMYCILAVAWEFAGDKIEAMAWYEKSLKLHPTTAAKGLLKLLQIS